MPQLQNNNRQLIKSNSGNAPRNPSYINEVKTTEYKNIQSNAITITKGIGNFINGVSNKLIDYETKMGQIKTENNFNDLARDFSNKTLTYTQEYKKNPSEELTKQYENDVKAMVEKYEEQVPFHFRNGFMERVNNLQKSSNLDFFRQTADLEHQNKIFWNNLDNSLDTVNTNAYTGNDQAIAYELTTLPLKKQQLIDIYGELGGVKLYDGYVKDFIKNYMGGKLSADGDTDLDTILNLIENNEELKGRITPEEIDNYKKQIEEKREKTKQIQRNKETAEYLIKTNMTVNDIANGKINNYADIVNRLKETGADEYESQLILKFAGYSTDLPPDLKNNGKGNNKIGKELNRKKTEYEKMEFENDLNVMLNTLYATQATTPEEREDLNNKIKQMQTKLILGVAGNYITAEKHSYYMNELMPFMKDILTKTVKDITPKNWSGRNKDLEKGVDEILKSMNIDVKGNIKNNKDKERYYFVKNTIFNNYIKSMRKQFENIKQNDVNNKYGEVDNWRDFQKVVDEDLRKKMNNKAVKEALGNFTQNEFNIKLTGEETINDLLEYIQAKEENNLMDDFKNNIIEIQYSTN